jgi:multiple antibiotic resistance protein
MNPLIEYSLYFLALINPASKILFLSSKEPPYTRRDLVAVSLKSSFVAWAILAIVISCGNFIFSSIFHVEIYSLSVAGGVILFIVGLNAVRHGTFYEKAPAERDGSKSPSSVTSFVEQDVSIVPLAAPLIAGPGTMTAAISFARINGIAFTLACVTIGVIINLLFMLMAVRIGRFLERVHASGPVIRISGLIVTAVAMQMIFSGVAIWVGKFG